MLFSFFHDACKLSGLTDDNETSCVNEILDVMTVWFSCRNIPCLIGIFLSAYYSATWASFFCMTWFRFSIISNRRYVLGSLNLYLNVEITEVKA